MKWGTNQSQEIKRIIRSRDVQNESMDFKKEHVKKKLEALSLECAVDITRIHRHEFSICLTKELIWETLTRFIPSLGWKGEVEGGKVPVSSRKTFWIPTLYNPNLWLMQIARWGLLGPLKTEALSSQLFPNSRLGHGIYIHNSLQTVLYWEHWSYGSKDLCGSVMIQSSLVKHQMTNGQCEKILTAEVRQRGWSIVSNSVLLSSSNRILAWADKSSHDH